LAMTAGGWATIKLVNMPLHGVISSAGEALNAEKLFALGFDWDICTPYFSEINFNTPANWISQEFPQVDLSGGNRINFPVTPLADISLCNEGGAVIGNVQKLFSELAAGMRKEGVDSKRVSHDFPEPTFIRMSSSAIPYFKVQSVSVNIEVRHSHQTRRVKMSNFSQLVLHQLNSDRTWWFAATPSVVSLFHE
jgi:hypothetical protein